MTRQSRKRAALITATAVLTAATATIGVSVASADSKSAKPSKKEIAALFDGWNKALQTGDPEKVTNRYADDAVLLPTVSNKIRTNHAEIEDYFHHFLEKGSWRLL